MLRYLLFFFLAFCVACKSQKSSDSQAPDNNEKMTLLLTDNYGGTEAPELLVIREKGPLKSFFTKINKTRKPGLPMPEVDFTKEMIIIYCSGKTAQASEEPLFTLDETEEQMILGLRTAEEGTSTAIVMPFALYKAPLTAKEVVLKQ